MNILHPAYSRVNPPSPQRIGDLVGRVLGRILRRRRRWRPREEDPQQALLDRLTDDELLDLLGPSWSAMTLDQRERYPSRWTAKDWAEVEARANLSPLPPDNSYVRLLTLPKPERVATVATWSLLRALDSWTALRGGAA